LKVPPLPLTHKEYDLLHLFLTHPQQIFSREQLLDLLWGYDYSGDTRTVDTHIRRLRAKLDKAGLQGGSIATVWGRGYRWELGGSKP
jgi:two-component system response regulator ResD